MSDKLRELALNGAVTEMQILVDEVREWARDHMLKMDHELEQTRAINREKIVILSEMKDDRRRLHGVLQRAEGILGLIERFHERLTKNEGLGDGEKGERSRCRESDL